jgi:hypothetical protein
MIWLPQTIREMEAGGQRLKERSHGVVETAFGELRAIHLRPWPKVVSLTELWPMGPRYHARGAHDRCLLYFNHPRRMPNFLALRYVVTTTGTSYRTFRAALVALDAIAEIRGIDAIVCDAANMRLSERFMRRMGWEPHKPQRWHRNYIRRFYGVYPPSARSLAGAS